MTSNVTGQTWIETRDNRTGRQLAVAVPSQSVPGKYHLVGAAGCDCLGFQHRGTCSHLRAVRAEIEGRRAEPVPATLPSSGIPGSGERVEVRVPLVGRLSA